MTAETACPACDSHGACVFFETDAAPVLCNVLCDSREAALAAPRAPIRLACCPRCEFIWNVAFDEDRIEYEHTYENSLHFSPHFRQYADELAQRLAAQFELKDSDILEIGCGDGDFLARLCELGGNRGVGFDPGHNAANAPTVSAGTLTIHPRMFTRADALRTDFMCCRHVLEHITAPVGFLRELHAAIVEHGAPAFYLEVPNALYTLRDLGIWDIIYEHCTYFTPPALDAVLRRSGFATQAVAECYGGQFIGAEGAITNGDQPILNAAAPPTDGLTEMIARFSEHHRTKLETWRATLDDLRRDGRTAVVWGAGSKGVTFLNALGRDSEVIRYVVDVNPRKRGRFVVGAGQEVIGPDQLSVARPDVVVLMNTLYTSEVSVMMSERGLEARLITA